MKVREEWFWFFMLLFYVFGALASLFVNNLGLAVVFCLFIIFCLMVFAFKFLRGIDFVELD